MKSLITTSAIGAVISALLYTAVAFLYELFTNTSEVPLAYGAGFVLGFVLREAAFVAAVLFLVGLLSWKVRNQSDQNHVYQIQLLWLCGILYGSTRDFGGYQAQSVRPVALVYHWVVAEWWIVPTAATAVIAVRLLLAWYKARSA